jgi:hypothetical protein
MKSPVFSAVIAPDHLRLEPVSTKKDGRKDTTSW